jgi:CBS domain-containing protein
MVPLSEGTDKLRVREVMNSPVITARVKEKVSTLAKKMRDYKVGSIIIAQGKKPVGIVTEGDIVRKVVSKDLKPSEILAEDIMSHPVITIPDDHDVTEAAKVMRKKGIKRLGVTYKGRLIGIASVSDLTSVTPELAGLIYERARLGVTEPKRRGSFYSGYCDSCRSWSEYLVEVDGRFLCEDCRGEKELIEEA